MQRTLRSIILIVLNKSGARLIRLFVALAVLAHWGASASGVSGDPDAEKPPATRAVQVQPVSSLFATEDYPQAAVRAGEQGTTEVGLTIASDGRVAKCQVLKSSGSAALDDATCTIYQARARFTPARDSNGRPATDYTTTRVRWALPATPLEEKYARAVFPIGPSDQGKKCTVETSDSVKNVKLDCNELVYIKQEFLTGPDAPAGDALVVEMGTRLGSGDTVSAIGTGPGLRRLAMLAFTLTIDGTGKTVECRAAVPGIKDEAIRKTCDAAKLQRYEPLPETTGNVPPRLMTSYQTVYLRGASTPPRLTNLGVLFSSDDYPADALAAAHEGTTGVKITVEANGHASGCVVTASAGMTSLDSLSCKKIMEGGTFEPGRDPKGHAQRSELFRRIRWELPVSPLRDSYTRVTLSLGPNGTIMSCTIEGRNDDNVTCDDAKSEAELALKSAPSLPNKVLVVEHGEMIGSGEPVENLGSGRGNSAWYLSAITIEIGADGHVIGCKPTSEWMKNADTDTNCEYALKDKFTPLPANYANQSSRYFTRYDLIYFR